MTLDVAVRHRRGDFILDAAFASEGGTLALFGSSGAGKTTLIDILAGLLRPQQGRVTLDGAVLLDTDADVAVPVHKRRIATVFQDGRLFPHMSVRRNLAYGARFSAHAPPPARQSQIIEMLGIGHLLARSPVNLSGGEKQRVAIGRALLSEPRLLLLDEPLASLDQARKDEIMPYLETLKHETQMPIVFVSHDAEDVARLADRIVVLENGQVRRQGPARDVLAQLEIVRLAARPHACLIEARVEDYDSDLDVTRLSSRSGLWHAAGRTLDAGANVRLVIDPTDVIVALEEPTGISALNVFHGIITDVRSGAGSVSVAINCRGDEIVATVTKAAAQRLALGEGLAVYAVIKAVALDRRAPSVLTSSPRTAGQSRSS